MTGPDASNILFQLAADMVNNSSQNIFLTGKAGTGKTTFLKYIKQHCAKHTAIVAPTGVAAINAGGTTIHSFFQLPPAPFIPVYTSQSVAANEIVNKHSLWEKIKLTAEKRNVLQSLELLIIDEISMVRCDLMDAIDTVLRHCRGRYFEPFGGVQLLLIGDMYQLPPVITENDQDILTQFYDSPYFFSSYVLQQNPPAFISFEKIYRQSDPHFIELLNQVRNNEMDVENMSLLHSRYRPNFHPAKEEGYIILTTHNFKADNINKAELDSLTTPPYTFKASIEGEFSEKAFPADELLKIKKGAQVMFVRNDVEKHRRYYNGKIGTITDADNENIFVQCKDEKEIIEVSTETWENIRYTFNSATQKLEEEIIGSFTQFPLRLAWAITIHKSQGLTFEKAIVDAGAAFAPGQVYVALSRCTNLEGLVLHSRILRNSILTDERIVAFSQNKPSLAQLKNKLNEAKHLYQQSLLLDLCQFSVILQNTGELLAVLKGQAASFNHESLVGMEKLFTQVSALEEVSRKFQPHLNDFFKNIILPHSNPDLQNRVMAAAKYFSERIEKILLLLELSPVIAKSRPLAKQFGEKLSDIHRLLAEKLFMFEFCKNGFDAALWHQRKNEFKIPPFVVNADAGSTFYTPNDSPYPELYRQLYKFRDEICAEKQVSVYTVAGSSALFEITTSLPQSLGDLAKISGLAKATLDNYGQQFVNIISQYCREHKLHSSFQKKPPVHQQKETGATQPYSKLETLKLYKKGKSINEIAAGRNLALQTVQSHLAHFVERGKVKIHDIISQEKLDLIEAAIKNYKAGAIKPIKEQLGNNVTLGDIRLVMAWNEYKKKGWKITGQSLLKSRAFNLTCHFIFYNFLYRFTKYLLI